VPGEAAARAEAAQRLVMAWVVLALARRICMVWTFII